ncbi:MAG: hypothetical protein JEZ12_09180 [Desulfobacterium sp.]|nr:hypothetical protein [Desulfobacterium sp.]
MKLDREKLRPIVLVLTSLIFATMVYFRFVHQKPKKTLSATPAKLFQEQTNGDPLAPFRHLDFSAAISQEKPLPPFRSTLPDIFTSPLASAPKMNDRATPPEPPLPSPVDLTRIKDNLRFQGSIIGERDAVAIINDQFLHVGDRLQGFTLASITENRVELVQGGVGITLEMIPHD